MQISSGGTEALAIMARTGLAAIVFVLTHVFRKPMPRRPPKLSQTDFLLPPNKDATRSNSTEFCAYYDLACTPNPPPNLEPRDKMSCAKHRLGWENCTRELGESKYNIACLSVYAPFRNDTLHYRRCFIYHQGVTCNCIRLEPCCCRGNFCNNVTLSAPRTPNPSSRHSTGATSSPVGASTQSPTGKSARKTTRETRARARATDSPEKRTVVSPYLFTLRD